MRSMREYSREMSAAKRSAKLLRGAPLDKHLGLSPVRRVYSPADEGAPFCCLRLKVYFASLDFHVPQFR
jgi:hypothetical protein